MKSKYCTLLVMPLIIGMMASCGDKYRESANEGSNVLTKELLDANAYEAEVLSGNLKFEELRLEATEYALATASRVTNFNDVIRFTFADGKIQYYSLIKKEVVIETDEWTDERTYYINANYHYLLYVPKVNTEGDLVKEKAIDRFGNVIYESTGEKSFLRCNYTYLTAQIDGLDTDIQCISIYYYDENGYVHVENVYYLGNEIIKRSIDKDYFDNPWLEEIGKPYTRNNNGSDLKIYGYDGYFLETNGSKYVVYDKDGKVYSSYTVDQSYSWELWMDHHFITQQEYIVDEFSSDYTYTKDGNYYFVETYQYDILTGEKVAIDVDYRIYTCNEEILNKDKIIKYNSVDMYLIDSNRLIDSTISTFIVDSEGVRHNNMTNAPILSDLIKWGDGYASIDGVSILFYNKQLDVKKVLLDASIIENTKLIAYQDQTGVYGVIDENFNVVAGPKFARVYTDYGQNNIFMAEDLNSNAAFYKIENGKATPFIKFNNIDGYVLFNRNTSDNILEVQKDLTSPIEYYNLSNGEEVIIPEKTSTFTTYISELFAHDYVSRVWGELGFDSAIDAYVFRLFTEKYESPLKK